jgi:hypothetical protein
VPANAADDRLECAELERSYTDNSALRQKSLEAQAVRAARSEHDNPEFMIASQRFEISNARC